MSPKKDIPLTTAQVCEVIARLQRADLIEVPRYRIQLVKGDDNSYINYEPSGAYSIDDWLETPNVQTIFTQEEIDNDPILKALESYKVDVKEVQND